MSNNIYDILKKIENLESPKQALTESKAMNTVKELHNESKKEKQTHKGTIAEAVAQVEKQLSEKYMGFKKAAAAGKKLGEAVGLDPNLKSPNWDEYMTIDRAQQARTGKYDPDIGSIAAWEKDVQGQQKYKSRTEPGIINKVKDTFGLDKPNPAYGPKDTAPVKEAEVEESGLQAYLGKKKYGETGMKALQKAGREGASKEKMAMIRAKHDKMDEGNQLPAPPDEVHLPKKGSKHGPVDVYKKPKNEDMLSPKEKSFAALAEPKDKITYADKIAGAKKGKKDESNKFIGNVMKARAQGKTHADLDGDGDMEKVTRGVSTMREGWEEMQKYLEKKRGPQSKGGEGKKAGTRYGGSAQKDDDEDLDGEGKPQEKKRGRPKGTGGGAKFSFKKPKD